MRFTRLGARKTPGSCVSRPHRDSNEPNKYGGYLRFTPTKARKTLGPCVSRSRKDGNKSSKCSSYLRFTRLAARVFIGLPFDVRQIRGRPGFLLGLAKEQKGIEGVQNDSAEEPSLCRRSAKTAADRLGRSRQSHSRICRHSSVSRSKPHAAFAGLVEGSGTAGRPIFGSICLT